MSRHVMAFITSLSLINLALTSPAYAVQYSYTFPASGDVKRLHVNTDPDPNTWPSQDGEAAMRTLKLGLLPVGAPNPLPPGSFGASGSGFIGAPPANAPNPLPAGSHFAVSNNAYIGQNLNTGLNLLVGQDLTVNRDAFLNRDTTIARDLTVTQNAFFNGTLNVTNLAVDNLSARTAGQPIAMQSNLELRNGSNATTIALDRMSGRVTANGGMTVLSPMAQAGQLVIQGNDNGTIRNLLSVDGDGTNRVTIGDAANATQLLAYGLLTANNGVRVNNAPLSMYADATAASPAITLSPTGAGAFNGSVTANGLTSTGGLTVTAGSNALTVTSTGGTQVTGPMGVGGFLTASGGLAAISGTNRLDVTATGTQITGATVLKGDVSIKDANNSNVIAFNSATGAATFNGAVTANGLTSTNGLTVNAGGADITGLLRARSGAQVDNGLTVNGDATVTGTLTVGAFETERLKTNFIAPRNSTSVLEMNPNSNGLLIRGGPVHMGDASTAAPERLYIHKGMTVGSATNPNSDAIFMGPVVANRDAQVFGTLNVDYDPVRGVGGSIRAGGTVVAGAGFLGWGDLDLRDPNTDARMLYMSSTFNGGKLYLFRGAEISGGLNVVTGGLNVQAGGADIQGGLTVRRSNGNVAVSVDANGLLTANNGLAVTSGGADITDGITVRRRDGTAVFYSHPVQGDITISAPMTATQLVQMLNGLTVNGPTNLTGNVTVSGQTTLGNKLTVNAGGADISGPVSLDNGLLVRQANQDALNVTSGGTVEVLGPGLRVKKQGNTGGDLVVEGGLWVPNKDVVFYDKLWVIDKAAYQNNPTVGFNLLKSALDNSTQETRLRMSGNLSMGYNTNSFIDPPSKQGGWTAPNGYSAGNIAANDIYLASLDRWVSQGVPANLKYGASSGQMYVKLTSLGSVGGCTEYAARAACDPGDIAITGSCEMKYDGGQSNGPALSESCLSFIPNEKAMKPNEPSTTWNQSEISTANSTVCRLFSPGYNNPPTAYSCRWDMHCNGVSDAKAYVMCMHK